jgi:hypothetical protein
MIPRTLAEQAREWLIHESGVMPTIVGFDNKHSHLRKQLDWAKVMADFARSVIAEEAGILEKEAEKLDDGDYDQFVWEEIQVLRRAAHAMRLRYEIEKCHAHECS